MLSQLFGQLLRRSRILPLLLIPVGLIIGFAALVSWKTGQPIYLLFQDIFFLQRIPLYTGFVSNVSAFARAAAAAISAYTAFLLAGRIRQKKAFYFFVYASILSALLLLDDFFMFHEIIYPRYFHAGAGVIYFLYAVLGLGLVVIFREMIFADDFILLLFSFGFLALSILFDEWRESRALSPAWIIAEDGSKLAGITYWIYYLSATGRKHLIDPAAGPQTKYDGHP